MPRLSKRSRGRRAVRRSRRGGGRSRRGRRVWGRRLEKRRGGSITINVVPTTGNFNLGTKQVDVEPSDNISTLMDKILKQYSIDKRDVQYQGITVKVEDIVYATPPPEGVNITSATQILDKDATVSHYNITNDQTINLCLVFTDTYINTKKIEEFNNYNKSD